MNLEDLCIHHFTDEQYYNLGEVEVKLIVGGEYPFLDGVVNLINLWDVFAFGDGVEPNIHEGQCAVGLFKLAVHMHFLNAEAAVVIVSLDLFVCFYHKLD